MLDSRLLIMHFLLNVHLVSTEHSLMTWLIFSLATCLVLLGFWASVAASSFVTVFATNMATRCRFVAVEPLVPSGIVGKHNEFETLFFQESLGDLDVAHHGFHMFSFCGNRGPRGAQMPPRCLQMLLRLPPGAFHMFPKSPI